MIVDGSSIPNPSPRITKKYNCIKNIGNIVRKLKNYTDKEKNDIIENIIDGIDDEELRLFLIDEKDETIAEDELLYHDEDENAQIHLEAMEAGMEPRNVIEFEEGWE